MSNALLDISALFQLDTANKIEIRNFIDQMQLEAEASPNKVCFDDKVQHHFSKDVYARELFIPAGTLIIGKIHKHTNLNILSQGEISLLSIDGVKRVSAPYTVVSSPGVKRLAYAHTDCVWTTIHGTDETDIDKIEDQFIAKNYNEVIEDNKENLCLGGQ